MICGIELGIWMALKFIAEAASQQHHWLQAVSWLILFYMIYGVTRCVAHYRDVVCGGTVRFGDVFRYVYWLFLFGAIIAVLPRILYLQVINPDYLTTLYDETMKVLPALQMPVTGDMATALHDLLRPVRFSLYYLLMDVLAGVGMGLFLGIFFQRKKI